MSEVQPAVIYRDRENHWDEVRVIRVYQRGEKTVVMYCPSFQRADWPAATMPGEMFLRHFEVWE